MTAWITALSIMTLLTAMSAGRAVAAPLFDLSEGQVGRFEYESTTPPDRHLYARHLVSGTTSIAIAAELMMPPGVSSEVKLPAVVLSHGSGGMEPPLRQVWAKALNTAGYAVLIPDSYTPRGVLETNSNQSLVPYPAQWRMP